jgi:hypothetical protein
LALAVHPFAVVFVLLGSAWILFRIIRPHGGFDRAQIARGIGFSAGFAFLALSIGTLIWLPWIAQDPELFRVQFTNNVLGRAGPGLLGRLLAPGDSLAAQYRNLLELCGPLQLGVLAFGTVAALCVRRPEPRRLAWWTIAVAVVLAILEGEHPTKGYWAFPAATACLCCGCTIRAFGRWRWLPTLLLFAGFLPGAGLKAAAVYARHWGDPRYDHRAVVRQVLADLPKDADYLVDVGCVFDFHAAGRKTTLALDVDPFFRARGLPYDYLVLTRTGIRQRLPEALGAARKIAEYGLRDDDLAVYIEVWSASAR